jgi:pre-rRNA-processing protein TSR1
MIDDVTDSQSFTREEMNEDDGANINDDDDNDNDNEDKMAFRDSKNKHFPDEIQLDEGETARERLQRYRGVTSLRTSDWDPNESLPAQYSQIFRFANYRHSKSAATKDLELLSSHTDQGSNPFQTGQKLCLHLEKVPVRTALQMTRPSHTRAEPIDRGIIGVFGLLRHEQKPTIVNVLLTVTPGSRINSKQHLIAIIGPRKILIRPILSEHTSHRLHRTLKSADDKTGFFVATFIAPATYDPSPVLVFEKNTFLSPSIYYFTIESAEYKKTLKMVKFD